MKQAIVHIALVVRQHDEWAGLCRGLGRPEWIEDERFCSPDARGANVEIFDELLSA